MDFKTKYKCRNCGDTCSRPFDPNACLVCGWEGTADIEEAAQAASRRRAIKLWHSRDRCPAGLAEVVERLKADMQRERAYADDLEKLGWLNAAKIVREKTGPLVEVVEWLSGKLSEAPAGNNELTGTRSDVRSSESSAQKPLHKS